MAEKLDEKTTWLADQIFKAYPQEVSALKLYTLGCGCIYYQRILDGGTLDSQVGVYRDADDGPCEVCMHLEKEWEERVVDENLIYKARIRINSK